MSESSLADNIVDPSCGDPKCWVTTVDELVAGQGAKDGGKNLELWIPPYQRVYAWDKKNVDRLCKDLNTAFLNGCADYHLGTLIFHKDEITDVDENKKKIWAVVDGQQRLTTIGVLLKKEDFLHRSEGKKLSQQDREMIQKVLSSFGDRIEKILECLRKSTVVCILVEDVAEAFQLFDTQNGRGKELSPVNLLKAYHFHEMNRSGTYGYMLSDRRIRELEIRWEQSNTRMVQGGMGLLSHVFSEHLFRLRHWSRGDDPLASFTKENLGEFQGLTLGNRKNSLPLQNSAILRKLFRDHFKVFGFSLDTVGGRLGTNRSDPEGMDPFMTITQAIVNGEDFFDYAETYSVVYRELFDVYEKKEGEWKSVSLTDSELDDFRKFYQTYCKSYYGSGRTGDAYIRHVYESACIFCFDRFGAKGLLEFYRDLYRLAYYDRVVNRSLYYQSAGSTYIFGSDKYHVGLIPAMLTSETIAELGEEIQKRIDNMAESCCAFEGKLFLYDKNGGWEKSEPEMPRWQFVFGKDNVKQSNIAQEEVKS